jgi:TFIIF-interacting CTD phosphatase-like protein
MPLTNKTIVLDLDSTLVNTCDEEETFNNLEVYTNPRNSKLRSRIYYFEIVDVCDTETSPVGSGQLSKMWGVLRPHVYEFLEFCFEYFENVIVWSAGQKRYVHAICDFLFNEIGKQPSIIFTYEDCIRGQNFIHKPLSKIHRIPIETIVALDDNESTFSKNKDNGLHIPAYEPEFTFEGIMKDEDSLLNLIEWLKSSEVYYSSDIRKPDKTYCFISNPNSRNLAIRKNNVEEIIIEEDNQLKMLSPKED